MKRIIVMAALLVAASACTTTEAPSNNAGVAANANANANANMSANANASPATTSAEGVSDTAVIAREQQVWDAIKRKDFDAFGNFLADDEIEIDGDGVYDKAKTIDGVKKLALTDVSLTDFKVVKLDNDGAVVTYTVNMKGTYEGKPMPEGASWRESTAWINRSGKWQAVYHQGTRTEQAQHNQPAAGKETSKTATATASPASATASPASAASPATSTASAADDPVAKEKQVWEAIKRKDYEGFGKFLTDEMIEVEPDGVYTKATSIEGMKHVDLSSAVQSDYKETKLDADASLVTYTVREKNESQRHSSIWVKRNGQWLAVFHQGTPVTKH